MQLKALNFVRIGVYALSFLQRMLGSKPVRMSVASSFAEEGIDMFTTAVMEYDNGAKTHFDCGMVLETEKNLLWTDSRSMVPKAASHQEILPSMAVGN